MPPNAARLTVTPEDTLEFGKELGAGAFGTVYEVRTVVHHYQHVIYKILAGFTE